MAATTEEITTAETLTMVGEVVVVVGVEEEEVMIAIVAHVTLLLREHLRRRFRCYLTPSPFTTLLRRP